MDEGHPGEVYGKGAMCMVMERRGNLMVQKGV